MNLAVIVVVAVVVVAAVAAAVAVAAAEPILINPGSVVVVVVVVADSESILINPGFDVDFAADFVFVEVVAAAAVSVACTFVAATAAVEVDREGEEKQIQSQEIPSKASPRQQHLSLQQTHLLQPHPLPSSQLQHSPSQCYLRGVDVIGETTLSVTNEAQTFHWAGYGLKLHIPPASLPAGVEHTSIEMKASLTGEFNFPENTTLVSAVYSLRSPVEFSQPIAVEIQHCAIPSCDPSLTIARATQEEPPYKFIALEGGLFPHDSCYACIQLSRFSLVATIKEWPRGLLKWLMGLWPHVQPHVIKQLLWSLLPHVQRRYCAHVYYTREAQTTVHFVITQDLEVYITVMKDEYKEAESPLMFGIAFEEDEIVLKIPAEGVSVREQWTVTPMAHPGITKEDVVRFRRGQSLPSCHLGIRRIGNGRPASLDFVVKLKGAKQPCDYFHIMVEDGDSQTQQSSRGEDGTPKQL